MLISSPIFHDIYIGSQRTSFYYSPIDSLWPFRKALETPVAPRTGREPTTAPLLRRKSARRRQRIRKERLGGGSGIYASYRCHCLAVRSLVHLRIQRLRFSTVSKPRIDTAATVTAVAPATRFRPLRNARGASALLSLGPAGPLSPYPRALATPDRSRTSVVDFFESQTTTDVVLRRSITVQRIAGFKSYGAQPERSLHRTLRT